MNKEFNSLRFKKFITPNEADELLNYIGNTKISNDELNYRIKTGCFSKSNQEKSIGIFYVDILKRKIAGIVFVYSEKEILADLETMKEYRGNGIGTKLVLDAISLGAIYLSVDDENKTAINIYKKCGFKEYYYDEQQKLIFMSLTGMPHPNDIEFLNK